MPVKGIFNFDGFEEYVKALQKFGADVDEAAIYAVEGCAPLVDAEIRKMAEEHKLTGATVNSIYRTPLQASGSFYYVEVGANTDGDSAALYDEFGTAYMEPRPFFRQALSRVKGRWKARIKALLIARMGVYFK
jgi:HK97 gp10 family phage protein